MGKIRIKTFGDENQELEDSKKLKEKREQKKLAKDSEHKDEEKITAADTTSEELKDEASQEEAGQAAKKGKKTKFVKVKTLSKRYKENNSLIDKNTSYPLKNAVAILKKLKLGKFDETIELHINVKEKGISGQVSLPHGTGKKVRVKIADDAVIAEIEKGKIEFDVLVASPDIMPKLAKVARVLGPKGLMPNPKNGTITDKPEALIEKLTKGQINYRTEAQFPIIHLIIGKMSFDENQLEENIKTAIDSISSSKIDKVTLKSTMSPAIRLQISKA